MIAVDTNVLVYSHRRDSDWHNQALSCLRQLSQSQKPWGLPWPCLAEFYSVVTHPRIYKNPSPPAAALAQMEAWLNSPSLILMGESKNYWPQLKTLIGQAQIRGGAVHDARIASLCLTYGVSELWSADKDFSRYPGLSVRNPLVVEIRSV